MTGYESFYQYMEKIMETIDDALNELPSEVFRRLLHRVQILLEEYEEGEGK